RSFLGEMSFLEHLEELRWSLIKSIIAIVIFMSLAFPFSEQLINILTLPNNQLEVPPKLIFLKPAGMLMVRLGVAIAVGIIAAFPVLFYQMWKFISPGLLNKEKKVVLPVVFFSTVSFILGVLFAYFVMLPFILPFLYGLGTENIVPTINISDYIGFSLRIILVAGLAFELPMVSYFLTKIGLLKPQIMRKFRRYAVVVMFILAAFLTPPDPGSQVLLAVPLLLLYEISILISYLVYRKKEKKEEIFET
ncbi:MAG TPA: twin-arginine translocase subunit TatC, partial [Bacteroidetes bacterium]|nr:twin-arginine translocase subunit TatC [Bacteroidota bacterium]